MIWQAQCKYHVIMCMIWSYKLIQLQGAPGMPGGKGEKGEKGGKGDQGRKVAETIYHFICCIIMLKHIVFCL